MLLLSFPMLHTCFFVCFFFHSLQRPQACSFSLFFFFVWPRLKVQIASTCPARPTIHARTAACVWRSWTSSVSLRASAAAVAEASPAPAAKSTWTSAPPVPAPTASATTVRSRAAASPLVAPTPDGGETSVPCARQHRQRVCQLRFGSLTALTGDFSIGSLLRLIRVMLWEWSCSIWCQGPRHLPAGGGLISSLTWL